MNVRHTGFFIHFLLKIVFDNMDLRLFYFRVTIYAFEVGNVLFVIEKKTLAKRSKLFEVTINYTIESHSG